MSLNIGLAGKHTGVHKLYGGDGAMLVDRVGNRCKVRYTVVAVELEVFGDIDAVYRVYVRLAHMDDGTAAACLALIIRHQGLGRDVFDRQVAVTGRGCKDPVAQNGAAKLKGLKKIWVLTFVHICFSFPFSLSSAVSFVSMRVNCLSFTV